MDRVRDRVELLDRLRHRAPPESQSGEPALETLAADEIERLSRALRDVAFSARTKQSMKQEAKKALFGA